MFICQSFFPFSSGLSVCLCVSFRGPSKPSLFLDNINNTVHEIFHLPARQVDTRGGVIFAYPPSVALKTAPLIFISHPGISGLSEALEHMSGCLVREIFLLIIPISLKK